MPERRIPPPPDPRQHVLIAAERYPAERLYHLLDGGLHDTEDPYEYETDAEPVMDPGAWVVEALRLRHAVPEDRARFFLGYAEQFGCCAWNPETGVVTADRWDLSDLVPERTWRKLTRNWHLDEDPKIEVTW